MALTERYVTQAAAGGGDGSSGNPWTFAEAITHSLSNTGQRYNLLSDGTYSIGATTFGAGAMGAPNVWRGYEATIGDLDAQGRNSDGTLNTTNMPAITITGLWTMANYVVLQNLNISGALSSQLIGDTSIDLWRMLSCKVVNTQNNSNASCIYGDDHHVFINCDLSCTGASHNRVVITDVSSRFIDCRFEIVANTRCVESQSSAVCVNCVFLATGSQTGIGIMSDTAIGTTSADSPYMVVGCTFYNLSSAISSSATHTGNSIVVANCHVTDCGKFIDNTTNITAFDVKNRTRDNTSSSSTVELVTVGRITTDTGGAETDYVNAVSGDLHLLSSAAGYNASFNGSDIGGLQTAPPASGGGLMIPIGMNGGFNG